jgi:hypothetical protein
MYNSLAWVLDGPTFKVIACISCQISDYQRHVATLARTATIPGNAVNATACSHSKNELMLLSECKNVTTCLLFTYSLYLIALN